MSRNLFLKKSIKTLIDEASGQKVGGLRRTLSAFNLTMIGIGAIIGAGVFVFTGQAAAEYAGPAVTVSFILAAIICLFAALCYAEFSSLIPISGSAYSYAYATMGEFIAWIIGWGLTLEYLFSASTVAVGWSGYFGSLLGDLGITLPQALSKAPLNYEIGMGWESTGSFLNLPAMLIMMVIGLLVAVGIKAAAKFNNVMVFIKMLVIALFIGCGIFFVKKSNLTPFVPENAGFFGQFGFSGILRGAGLVFFAFIGFDALSTLAQEAKNPQKDLPKGMIGSLSISTLVYIAIALVLTGIVSYTQLNVADPIAVAVNALGPHFLWLRFFIKIAILASFTSVILVMLLGQSRIFYTMAKDGLLPELFSKVHDRLQTPFINTLILTGFGALVAGLFPVGILGQIVNMGTLMAFAIVCFGVLVLRVTQAQLHRPFKTPFVPWIPLAGTLACIVQMLMLPAVTWLQLFLWMSVGIFIYFSYGIKRSKIRQKPIKTR